MGSMPVLTAAATLGFSTIVARLVTLNPAPCTRNLDLETRNRPQPHSNSQPSSPALYAPNPYPLVYSPHPKPWTVRLHPDSLTPNHEPSTLGADRRSHPRILKHRRPPCMPRTPIPETHYTRNPLYPRGYEPQPRSDSQPSSPASYNPNPYTRDPNRGTVKLGFCTIVARIVCPEPLYPKPWPQPPSDSPLSFRWFRISGFG